MSTTLAAADLSRSRDDLLAARRPMGECIEADGERVDLIAELERIKSAACAIQAELSVDLNRSVHAQEAATGLSAKRRGRGVASQIALARQESPFRARQLLGFAHDLMRDLPQTHRALREGRLNEFRATVVARETGCLDSDDRQLIDAQLCGDANLLDGLGTGELAAEVRRRAYAADPASVVRRARKAESDRCVSVRPVPDTMTRVSLLVPVVQGVACFAALTREADRLIAAGDERTKGQLMADLAVERLTGQATADAVPVTVDLVISDETLLSGGHQPADVPGHGPVPAQIAREIVAAALDRLTTSWIRRLYADPAGNLVAMTSVQRLVPEGLSAFLKVRDRGICRTPWCDAPIRHDDHVMTVAAGGETSAFNTQGLCEQCNYAKEAPGWRQRTLGGDRHTVETTTPTGHTARSRAPAPPRPARSARPARVTGEFYLPRVDLVYEPAA